VRAAFEYAQYLLPLTVVQQGTVAAVYEHPRPVYGTRHLLIVPSRGIRDLLVLARPDHADVRAEMWRLREAVEKELGLANALINGGPRQDVLQVHMHVTDGDVPSGDLGFASLDAAVLALPEQPDLETRLREGVSISKSGADVSIV
jgi:hypothetical protein